MGTWSRVVAWLFYGAVGVAPPAPAPAPAPAAPPAVAASVGEGWRPLSAQDGPIPSPKPPARRPPKRPRPDADRIIAETQGRVSVMDDVDADVQAERDAQIRALGPDQRGGTYYAPPRDDARVLVLRQDLDQVHYGGGRASAGLGVGAGGRGTSGGGGGGTAAGRGPSGAAFGGGRGTSFGFGGTTAPHGPPIGRAYARAGGYGGPSSAGAGQGGEGTSFGFAGTTAPHGPPIAQAYARAADPGIPASMTAALRPSPRADDGGDGAVLPAPPGDGADFQKISAHGDGLFTEPPAQNSDGSWNPSTPQNW